MVPIAMGPPGSTQKLSLSPRDPLLALLSELPTACDLYPCSHCTLLFALSKHCMYLPITGTSVTKVGIFLSPRLFLKPLNSSILDPLHFCQSDLEADLLPTLPQLPTALWIHPRYPIGYIKALRSRGLCVSTPCSLPCAPSTGWSHVYMPTNAL